MNISVVLLMICSLCLLSQLIHFLVTMMVQRCNLINFLKGIGYIVVHIVIVLFGLINCLLLIFLLLELILVWVLSLLSTRFYRP